MSVIVPRVLYRFQRTHNVMAMDWSMHSAGNGQVVFAGYEVVCWISLAEVPASLPGTRSIHTTIRVTPGIVVAGDAWSRFESFFLWVNQCNAEFNHGRCDSLVRMTLNLTPLIIYFFWTISIRLELFLFLFLFRLVEYNGDKYKYVSSNGMAYSSLL